MKKFTTPSGYIAYETTAEELKRIGGLGVCDHCNETPNAGILIPVLNHWVCKPCFDEWSKTATYYEEDIDCEKRNAAYFEAHIPMSAEEGTETKRRKLLERISASSEITIEEGPTGYVCKFIYKDRTLNVGFIQKQGRTIEQAMGYYNNILMPPWKRTSLIMQCEICIPIGEKEEPKAAPEAPKTEDNPVLLERAHGDTKMVVDGTGNSYHCMAYYKGRLASSGYISKKETTIKEALEIFCRAVIQQEKSSIAATRKEGTADHE